MSTQYTELQLDALRELANIGSGTASTALSAMLGRSVDISVPTAQALPFADAVEAAGPAEEEITGIVLGDRRRDGRAPCCCSSRPPTPTRCAACSASSPTTSTRLSALGEIGNIVGTSYINALAAMTGMEIEPTPAATATDMLGAIVATRAGRPRDRERRRADARLRTCVVEGEDCSISFLLVPDQGGVEMLLSRLGLS